MDPKTTEDLKLELMKSNDIDSYNKENQALFIETGVPEALAELYEKHPTAKTLLARRAGMSEVYLHQVFSGRRTLSRDRLLCLCAVLEAALDETQVLLRQAGFAQLDPKNKRDAIISHGIIHHTGLEAPDADFDGRDVVTSVVIEEGVTSIGDSAFSRCSSLTSVTIPNGVTHLDSGNFTGCGRLTRVTIPASITSITPTIFSNCGKLTDIYYQGTAAQWKAIDGSDAFERWRFTIHFSDVPDVAVSASPAALTFQMEEDGVSYPLWVTVTNEGVVDITLVQPTATYFDISMERTSVGTGKSVRFSVQPKSGLPAGTYSETITVKTSDGQGTASVDVTLTVNEKPAPLPFNDVPEFWYQPVAWAVEKKITTGTTATTFAPNNNCTHGQILTFLWRAAREPASNVTTPFAMNGGEYYYGAAKWAYEKGMIGADFSHKTFCTRADAVSYIWQAFGRENAIYDGRFTDMPANSPYATAVAWAVDNGVTTGTTDTTFNPNGLCNRAQIVTFLYRAYNK